MKRIVLLAAVSFALTGCSKENVARPEAGFSALFPRRTSHTEKQLADGRVVSTYDTLSEQGTWFVVSVVDLETGESPDAQMEKLLDEAMKASGGALQRSDEAELKRSVQGTVSADALKNLFPYASPGWPGSGRSPGKPLSVWARVLSGNGHIYVAVTAADPGLAVEHTAQRRFLESVVPY